MQIGRNVAQQRTALPAVLAEYHGYLPTPPLQWQFMPIFHEVAPTFSQKFPEAANIFDNLHMLHDNTDDVLSSPDLFPTLALALKSSVPLTVISFLPQWESLSDSETDGRSSP